MRASEYNRLFDLEEKHWWFRSLHHFILKYLPKDHYELEKPTALEIGCGTGGFMSRLRSRGYEVFGTDLSTHALGFARRRNPLDLIQTNANALPFDTVFDLITCVDVLEANTVDPNELLSNAVRSLKKGGYAIFVAPAYQGLQSEHDRAVNSSRRFNLGQMKFLFADLPVEIVQASYLFLLIFPIMALRKLLNPWQSSSEINTPKSDIFVLPHWLNKLLYIFATAESVFLPFARLPLGTSVIAVVRKK